MRDDRELRQTLEELQSLRAAIQALPQMKLDRDFYQRVLERAKRNVRPSAPPRDPQASPLALNNPPSDGARWSRKSGLQSAAIACATLAALVLVAVMLPQRWTRSNIARHTPMARDRDEVLYEQDRVEQDDPAAVDDFTTDAESAGTRRRDATLSDGERLEEETAPRDEAREYRGMRRNRDAGNQRDVGNQAEMAFDTKSLDGSARSTEGVGARRGGTFESQSPSAVPLQRSPSLQSRLSDQSTPSLPSTRPLKSSPSLAPAAPLPREVGESTTLGDPSELALESPATDQRWSRLGTRAAGDGLPPAALSDYVVFVSGANPQRIGSRFRTALAQNQISEMPTAVEEPTSGQEREVQLVLVEAPLHQIQAAVKALSADRTNVQSILALSRDGDGNRVVSGAEDFGMLSGGLQDGVSWDDTLGGAKRDGQAPEVESGLAQTRMPQPTSEAAVARSEPKTERYFSETTKDNVPNRGRVDLGRIGQQPVRKGQAWFFSYAAEGNGHAYGAQAASRMSRSQPQPSQGAAPGTSVEAGDLAAGLGGGGAADVPDSTVQGMGGMLLREREALRKRIDDLKLPDTPDTVPAVEEIRSGIATKEEHIAEDHEVAHQAERDVAASGVVDHDVAGQAAGMFDLPVKDADHDVETEKLSRARAAVTGRRAIPADPAENMPRLQREHSSRYSVDPSSSETSAGKPPDRGRQDGNVPTDRVALGLEFSKGVRAKGPPSANSKMVRVLFVLQPVDANVPPTASEEAR